MPCGVFSESDFGMVEGGQQTIRVDLFKLTGEEYHVALDRIEWRLGRYGETACLISKKVENLVLNPNAVGDGILLDDNIITVTLSANDTVGLWGKFTHQAILTDLKGRQFILDLGKISIKPMIR